MNLVFKKTSGIEPFIDWLKIFKGISDETIVLETDVQSGRFLTKGSNSIRSAVRYSVIPFTESGFTVDTKASSPEIFQTENFPRINIGILKILSKFIELLKTFESSNEFTMTVCFDMAAESKMMEAKYIRLKSKTLTMNMRCASVLNNFKIISDEVFSNRLYVAPNSVSTVINMDIVKNIISISDIFKRSIAYMYFYTKNDETGQRFFYVKDQENTYDYKIGTAIFDEDPSSDTWNDINLPIYRNSFLVGIKDAESTSLSPSDALKLKISTTDTTRLLIDGNEGQIKTIISKIIINE